MVKAYVIATGALFALLVCVHIARLFAEGAGPLHDPVYGAATIVGLVVCVWAALVLQRLSRH